MIAEEGVGDSVDSIDRHESQWNFGSRRHRLRNRGVCSGDGGALDRNAWELNY